MGMTLWIHTLEDRNYSKDSDDHSLMNRHADALDAVCEAAGVRKLNEFMDFTDCEFNMGDFDDEEDDDEAESGGGEGGEAAADSETGLGYGIDDMAWFDAAEGLVSMKALRGHVAIAGIKGLDAGENAELLEELDDCIAVLNGPASRGGKFHLAVIE